MIRRLLVLSIVSLVASLLALAAPAAAQTDAGNGRLQIIEWTGAGLRAAADGRGGLWTVREQGIHHRDGERGAEGPRVGLAAQGHLAVDPRNGDLVYDTYDNQVRRVTRAGVDTVVASDLPGGVTSIDVASDGTVYVAAGPQDIQRIEPDGTSTTAVDTPLYVEALAAAPDGALVYFTERRLHRFLDGVDTVIAGGPAGCEPPDPCGDFGPATDARLGSVVLLDVVASGDIVIGELYGRVRAIVDGTMKPILGGWQRCMYVAPLSCGENGLSSFALVDNVVSMSMDGRTLYVVDERPDGRSSRLLRVGGALESVAPPHQGYRMIASDGGVFSFGWSPFHGSTGDLRLVSPIVAGRSNGAGGYWFVAGDGGVFTFGDAPFFGSAAGMTDSPVVDMVVRSDGDGYAVLTHDSSVLFFHRTLNVLRPDYGQPSAAIVQTGPEEARIVPERPSSLPRLNVPLVAARATRSGKGTWYVASDGGVFTDGDAAFFGSTGAMRLNQPVLDLIPTPSEKGYWLIAADGGVFTFGDAQFMGSMGGTRLNRPVVAGVAGPTATG